MSDPILPLAVWQSGTNQNSIPANDNALRLEALSRPCLGVANDPPTSDDGDVYLVGAVPTGDFSTFDEDDIAIFRSGNWYAWAPVDGLPLIVDDVRKVYAGGSASAWIDDPSITGGGGGGAPGGPTTAIQYNNAGSFAGEANFAYDEATNTMTVGNINVQTGGLAYTPPSTTANSGLRVAPGVAPTSPVNGDVWTTTTGMFVRINGVTVGPLVDASAGGAVTSVNGDTGAVIVPVPLGIACSDETTALTTGVAKATFRTPFAMTLTGVRASVTTAPTGSVLTVDINESGASILSTKITIDATEKTSTTAAIPPVISDASLADDAEITIDIDTVGSTIAGAGLKVWLIGYPA